MPDRKPEEIRGSIISCPDYYRCSICYGCRNYNENFYQCQQCRSFKVKSVCDTGKHRTDLLNRLYSKQRAIKITD